MATKSEELDRPRLISIKEASQILNVHPNTLRKWDQTGVLKAVRFGSRKDRSYEVSKILSLIGSTDKVSAVDLGKESNIALKRLDQILMVSAALSKLSTVTEATKFITRNITTLLGGQRGLLLIMENENLKVADFYNFSHIHTNDSVNNYSPVTDAIKYGEPIIIETPSELISRYPSFGNNHLNSQALVVLPLKCVNEVFGAIVVDFDRPQVFNKDDITFMLYLARQSAIALDRAYSSEQEAIEKQTDTRVKTLLKQINFSALRFLGLLNVEQTFESIISEAKNITGAQYGSVFLLKSDRMERVYASDDNLYKIKPRKKGDTFLTFQDKSPKVYQVKPHDPHPMLKRIGIKSVIRIPLFHRDGSKETALGTINMLTTEKVTFSDQELELLQLFGIFASLAISNAQIHSHQIK